MTGTRKKDTPKASGARKSPAAKTKKNSQRKLSITMYNVGFGDSFLLTIPNKGTTKRILLDCGVHSQGTNDQFKMDDVVEQIIDDVKDEDGVPRIDIIVCTHRHQDHVSGFSNRRWDEVEVSEVWMPWTEDPRDPAARAILRRQSSFALSLNNFLSARATPSDLQFKELVANCLTNEKAMATLHGGFSGDPVRRFLSVEEEETLIKPESIPGLSVFVMGPSKNPSVIKDMDPPKDPQQSYFQLADPAGQLPSSTIQPFQSRWQYSSQPVDDRLKNTIAAIKAYADIDFGSLAISLDKAVNGTSLMLMFKIGRAYLLFPGDAQWGTWNNAMQTPWCKSLLGRTTFYKVGHHGSHNATPVDFVEKLIPSDFTAMVSTRKMGPWPNIPRGPLLTALSSKAAGIARSDLAHAMENNLFTRSKDRRKISLDIEY